MAESVQQAHRSPSIAELWVGTASTFLVVPDLGAGTLALSGILLQTPLPAGRKADPDTDFRGGTARRVFHPGETITYAYQLLNPRLAPDRRRPKVETAVKLFRAGKEFFSGKPEPAPVGSDVKRLLEGGELKTGAKMPPGEYVLQITATDLLADANSNRTTQWIDFRVEP